MAIGVLPLFAIVALPFVPLLMPNVLTDASATLLVEVLSNL